MNADTPQPAVPRQSLLALAQLRHRLRRVFLRDGLLTVCGIALAAIALSFLADYALILPRGVRFVFLAVGGVALAILCQRRIARPLSQNLSDVDLANLVERANPELSQSLITAVELTRSGSEAAAHVSGPLLDSVVRDVEARVSTIRFDRIFDLRRLHRKALLGALGAVVLFGGAITRSDLASIWLSRNVLLSSEQWPKQTELALVRPDPGSMPVLVAIGDDLELEVRALRGDPPSVVVDSFAGDRLLRSDVLTQSSPGVFGKRIENVSKPFSFSVRGGDDEIGRFDVEVRLRPRIDMGSIQLWCDFPAYTGLASTPEAEPLRHGNLKVPEGTKVRYKLAANVDVRKAYFVFHAADAAAPATGAGEAGDGAAPKAAPTQPAPAPLNAATATPAVWPEPGAVEIPITGDRDLAGEIAVKQSGQYYFQLEAKDGFRSLRPDRFRLESVSDQKPSVKIVEPERQTEEVTVEAKIAVRVSATDDYGIEKGALEGVYFAPGKQKGVEQFQELPKLAAGRTDGGQGAAAVEPSRGAKKPIEDEVLLDVQKLDAGPDGPIAVGGRYQYWAQASDFAAHVGESQMYYFQIVEKDDLLRILTDQLMIVRDQLREALRRQKSSRKDLEELQSKLALREKIPPDEAPRLFRHRQDQGRVTQSLEREAGEVSRILLRTTRNNVGDEAWKGWVTGIRDDLRGLAEGKSPGIEKLLETIQREATASPQDVTRINSVSNSQREVERELESLVMRLSEFGDKNALIQMLRELRRRQAELREELRGRTNAAPAQEPQK